MITSYLLLHLLSQFVALSVTDITLLIRLLRRISFDPQSNCLANTLDRPALHLKVLNIIFGATSGRGIG